MTPVLCYHECVTVTDWRIVPGFPHLEVSRDGHVRSKVRVAIIKNRWGVLGTRTFSSREYRAYLSDNGYLRVAIYHPEKGRRHPAYVHRLIALAFVEGYVPGYHVNHINGGKTDNWPENLEWVPNEENVRHAWRHGLTNRASGAKLSPKRVRAVRRMLSAGVPAMTIAIACDMATATIRKIRDGLSWQHIKD